jgi:catechol 2,3-dioxygenase-like lactoylglutathione lyase family enzyme
VEEGSTPQEEGTRDEEGGRQRSRAPLMTGSFRIVALDHVQVTAPEELMDEVIDFYTTCLGLERVGAPEGTGPVGAWFRLGDAELHLSVDPHNPPKEAHFSIAVDDFEVVVDTLRACGQHIEQARAIPGRRNCFTRDPAGNRIEIMSYTEP